MRNKLKYIIAACFGCILYFGTAVLTLAAGTLSVALSSGTVAVGDTVTVTVYAAGADNSEVTADMKISYDSSKLEFVSSSSSGASGGGGTVTASGSDISFRFKALSSGDAYVKAEGATLTAAGAHITVSGTAGSNSTDTDTDTDTVKSGDNSLSSLSLSHGTLSPSFQGNVTEYTAQVGSDVSSITVNPVTSNSKASIESITGNTDLTEGKNVISVTVKAENGNTATYKITVTKGSGTTEPNEGDGSQEPVSSEGLENAPPAESSDGAIVIDGINYTISGEFSDESIPEGFSRANFEYKGTPCEGVMFKNGQLGMYYMVNGQGEGGFFVYNSDRDKFYPYVRLQSGERYIILIVVPNAVIPPDNYNEVVLEIAGQKSIPAYQYAGGKSQEIVKLEPGEEGGTVGQASDFYIFYATDDTGTSGWYQYDVKQETFQRLNGETLATSDAGEDYEALLDSYNKLNDRHKETKAKDRRMIAILIFVTVLFLIAIINLALKVRELRMDEPYEEERPKRKKRRAAPVRPARGVRAAKTEKPAQERPGKKFLFDLKGEDDEALFYDDDKEDFMDEFEEEPSILSRKARKKETPIGHPSTRKKRRSDEEAPVRAYREEPQKEAKGVNAAIDSEEDDLEFLDLNDL